MPLATFGQVISVLGPNVGFPGHWARTADTIIVARQVLSTTATNLPFGAGAVLIPSATGGALQSFADFLATASNAQYLEQYFAGIAVWNFKLQAPYSAYAQTGATAYTTTATQATIGATTIVVASATNLAAGQIVEGYGLQANTTVVSISGTTITISLATIAVLSTTTVTFTNPGPAAAVGYYPAAQIGEVLVRSKITVAVTAGTPQAGNPVYVRTVANANTGGTSVGDFEAASEVATNSITISTTIGSATLTTSAGTGLAVGQLVTGPGVPGNTYLTAGATTSWTMSNVATATASTQASVFYNTAILGSAVDPWIRFGTGQYDTNDIAEVLIANRHAL